METENKKVYDLEERTYKFANRVTDYVLKLPKTIPNIEYGHQVVRSSGSVGGNYIEANEGLGTKDFDLHIKISRKEAKESRHWLRLTRPSPEQEVEKHLLIKESEELIRIFSSMINKRRNKNF
jgi:four helix bundle protein